MRKNKMAAAILALAITTSLAGCGNHTPTTTEKDSISPSTVTSEMAEGTTSGENGSSVETSAPSTSAPEPSSVSEPESTASKPTETTSESTTTASQPVPSKPVESKPEQTKPVETKPAEKPTENSSTTPEKPAETKPQETKPAEKPTEPPTESKPEETPSVQPVQIADSKEVEAKVAQYINEYRNTNAVVLPGLTQVARYRSKQLVTHFAHDTKDEREALAYYKYGEYVDMTEYGYPESANHYLGYNKEAIAKGNWRGTADEIGREIAKGFRNSEGHWRYLSSDEYTFIAVGCTYDSATGLWYCCICMSSKDYGG